MHMVSKAPAAFANDLLFESLTINISVAHTWGRDCSLVQSIEPRGSAEIPLMVQGDSNWSRRMPEKRL